MRAALLISAVIITLAAVFPVGLAWGAEQPQERMKFLTEAKEPVSIQADRIEYDRKTSTYKAVGSVTIQQGAATLTADRVTLDEASGDAEAEGNARFVTDVNVIFAERMKVNFNTKLGVIEKGNIFVRDGNYHITGASLERIGENEYVLTKATMTTCDAATPFWKVTAGKLDVRIDKDVTARDVVIRIKDVPILYSPYAWFPLLKPRTTGLLLPSVGYSSKDGVRFKESLYWAPTDNFDDTLTVDYRSKRGVGIGTELRWALDKDTRTDLSAYFMDDQIDMENRYNLTLKHEQKLVEDFFGKADINYSDRQFYKDLTETAQERTQRSVDSNAFVTGLWDWGEGYLLGQFTQGLDVNNDVTVQRVPELGVNVSKKQLLGVPVYLDMDGSAAYFYKETGVKGGRYDIFPKVSGVFNLGGINVSPKVGYRETTYSLDPGDSDEFDDERGLLGAGVTAQTGYYRLYRFDGGMFEGIRHTVEPMAAYNYVMRRGGVNFPVFDGIDTYGRNNTAAYSLTNRFVLKFRENGGRPRVDYITLRLGQYYDLYGDGDASGEERKLSDLFGEVMYKADDTVTVTNYFRYDLHGGAIRSVDTDVRYSDPAGRWFAAVGQRYSEDTEATFLSPSRFDFFTPSTDFVSDFVLTSEDEDGKVDFLTCEAGVNIGGAWSFYGKLWYDIHGQDLREKDFSASYTAQCWGATITYNDRPGARQVMFLLNLKSLGSVKL